MRLSISQHALDRYRERFNATRGTDARLVDRLRSFWRNGDRMHRDGPAVVREFFEHGSIAEWRHYRGLIMIVSFDVMLTVVRYNRNHKPMIVKKHGTKGQQNKNRRRRA
jgi:hypothetical protein